MGKHLTKQQKIEILDFYNENGVKLTVEKYNISDSRIYVWRKELNDNKLSNSKSGTKKGMGKGRPKISYVDPNLMSRSELIEHYKASVLVKKFLASQRNKNTKQ